MLFDVRRSVWQNPAQPVIGPLIDWSKIDMFVIHYTAATNLPDGDAGKPNESQSDVWPYLRRIQNDYTVNRGYSIGYNAAVDVWGAAYELRGSDIKCAANKGENDHTFACLMLVDGDDRASQAAAARVRRLVADAEKIAGRRLEIVGHGQIGATSCPGVGLRKDIVDGRFNPTVEPIAPVVPVDEDVMTAVMVRFKGYLNVWLVGTGPALHLSSELFAHYKTKGVPYLDGVPVHQQMMKAFLSQSGCTQADMVPGGA